jgi:hypothetical protein
MIWAAFRVKRTFCLGRRALDTAIVYVMLFFRCLSVAAERCVVVATFTAGNY